MIQSAGSRECIGLLSGAIVLRFLFERQRLKMLALSLCLCVCTFCAQAEVTESIVNLHDRLSKFGFVRTEFSNH